MGGILTRTILKENRKPFIPGNLKKETEFQLEKGIAYPYGKKKNKYIMT